MEHRHGAHAAQACLRNHDSESKEEMRDERRLLLALLLTGGFVVAEVIGGIVSGSLALIADAGHMLTDTAALGLAWYAARVAGRSATPLRSYGHHRFQVLAAFINGASLIGIAAWIIIEAVRRFFQPVEVIAGPMLVIAFIGLLVNAAAFLILHRGNKENLNVKGALVHVVGDLLGSAAAIIAAGVILLTGWMPIDPLLSVLVALLVLRGALELTKRSWHLLMEGAPEDLNLAEIEEEVSRSVPGLLDIHHVHLWSLTPDRPLVTLHARIARDADHDTVRNLLQTVLMERFALFHVTIQTERSTGSPNGPTASPTDKTESPLDGV